MGTVVIIPSRTELTFDAKENAYYGTALVCNTSKQMVTTMIVGQYESVNTHKTFRINPNSYSTLKNALNTNSLGRKLLPSLESQPTNISVFSVKTSELQPPISMSVNDIDSTAPFSNNPSYLGEATVNEESFEPKGIDIPTQIYPNAQEAILLDKFPVEIRKYIKRIFHERYPECVSLHSLQMQEIFHSLWVSHS